MDSELQALERAARALLAHTSRTEIRRRHQLEAEFRRLATPELIVRLAAVVKSGGQATG